MRQFYKRQKNHSEMSAVYYFVDFKKATYVPSNLLFDMAHRVTSNPFIPLNKTTTGRTMSANLEMMERFTHFYGKPSFEINQIVSQNGCVYKIHEDVLMNKPFCRLIHFRKELIRSEFTKDQADEKMPKLLLVPPYSGHYGTLCRDTVNTLLKDHDLYLADWKNGRNVPLYEGSFKLEDYIQYLVDFLHSFGERVHIMGICQPALPVMATASIMAAHNDPCQPLSMTIMGGPIDTRVNPTKVNKLAKEKKIEWFDETVIARVPHYYPGALRRVCPGFILLAGFMSLNLERHLNASFDHFNHLVQGDDDSAEAHRRFYNEYRSVLDLPADYFLDSVEIAFQHHNLPLGTMRWKGETVDPKAIRRTALLTVEGEKDDISGVGQTEAAQALCTNIPQNMKKHYLQKGVGHYGVFNGKRWRESIAPVIRDFIKHVESNQSHSSITSLERKVS